MSENDAVRIGKILSRVWKSDDSEENVKRINFIFVLVLAETKMMWYITDVDSSHLGKNQSVLKIMKSGFEKNLICGENQPYKSAKLVPFG